MGSTLIFDLDELYNPLIASASAKVFIPLMASTATLALNLSENCLLLRVIFMRPFLPCLGRRFHLSKWSKNRGQPQNLGVLKIREKGIELLKKQIE